MLLEHFFGILYSLHYTLIYSGSPIHTVTFCLAHTTYILMSTHFEQFDDATLVAYIRAGQREAFSPLLARHLPSVLRLCRRLLGTGYEVQDIAQEAALATFIGLPSLTKPERFGAWLHAIAANLARMALRQRRLMSLEALLRSENATLLWPAPVPTPEEISAARELHDAIIAALSELTPGNRDVAVGYFLDGYSYNELAEILGVPVSTIKGRMFKSRRQLQHRLAGLAGEFLPTAMYTRKELPMSVEDVLPVRVAEIRTSSWSDQNVVILRAESGHTIPIWIGPFEANAIACHLNGQQPTRPMTHDLTLRLLMPLGASLQRVLINALAKHTFFAEMNVESAGKTHVVDARPSDAIALAVRCDAPIFVSRSVYESCANLEECTTGQPQPFQVNQIDIDATPFDPPIMWFLGQLAEAAGFRLDIANQYDWHAHEVELDGMTYMSISLPGDGQRRLLLEAAAWDLIQQRMTMMIESRRQLEALMASHQPIAP